MKIVALIPARCHSKTIPYKNIYLLKEKPLISYIIKALKNSIVDDIYVSTDCEKIKSVCVQYETKVIDRPIDLATDLSPTIDCVRHFIECLNLDSNDIIVLAQPTSPLTLPTDITNGIDTFLLGNYDIVISVVEKHSIQWEIKNNHLIPQNHELCKRKRRQDINKTFIETGSFYIFRVKNILENNCLYGNGLVGYIDLPKSRSFEIDNYEDIFIIESILKNVL